MTRRPVGKDGAWVKAAAEFIDDGIMPHAEEWDREERMPAEAIGRLARLGGLGAFLPEEYHGRGMPMASFGPFCEEIGRGSIALLSLVTVHGMMARSLEKWGSEAQRKRWLTRLADGEVIGAFGLSEPRIGSDAHGVETTAVARDDHYVLNGSKKWISFGQVADVFLVIAKCEGKPSAYLVEKGAPGVRVEPIKGMLGFRSAMLAQIHLEECVVPRENLVGRIGFGLSHVVGSALDLGRFCIAWGSVGLAQGALDACIEYVRSRRQFGKELREHQLIQELIADMLTNIRAARALCREAAAMQDSGSPDAIIETSIAKYFAGRTAFKVASDAVQIHGANGCIESSPVQRYFRDAKLLEIVEGSNQIQQLIIARCGLMQAARQKGSAHRG